jgi:hypothetical protein
MKNKPDLLHRDFLIDSLAADDSLKQWQYEIGHRRDMLQEYVSLSGLDSALIADTQQEKSYDDQATDFRVATVELHRLARHWLTLGQDSHDFNAQLGFLRESYVIYKEALGPSASSWGFDKVDMRESFDMLISQCDTCIRWTNVYHDRTSLRINLVSIFITQSGMVTDPPRQLFHLANQRESKTNTQIATSTAEVARQTQRDSASMITIAAVTMLFLPGTFISAILSTTFFDYGDDGLHVSTRWWILLATTIPLTIVVFVIWLGWRYVRLRKLQAEAPMKVE